MLYSKITKIGTRELNEDSIAVIQNETSFSCILADGLGGHARGEVASGLAVETALQLFEPGDTSEYLHKAFQESQKRIMEYQKQQRFASDMKTTMVILTKSGNTIQWGHIGDSRLYYFKEGRLKVRTLDHSVPQMLVLSGEMKEKDIRGHEDRNRLLRVMGVPWEVPRYELSPAISVEGDQAFLLCSDGFWELIEEKRIEFHLKRSDTPEEWLDGMEQEILECHAGKDMDNYSAIGVFTGSGKNKEKGFLSLLQNHLPGGIRRS